MDWHSSKVPKIYLNKLKQPSKCSEEQNLEQAINSKKENAVFSSRVPKLNYLDATIQQSTPGPGQYKTQSSFPLVFPRLYQSIALIPKQPQKYTQIGPGSYECDLQGHYATRRSYKPPFNSTEKRFHKQLSKHITIDVVESIKKTNPVPNHREEKTKDDVKGLNRNRKHLSKVMEIYQDLLNKQ